MRTIHAIFFIVWLAFAANAATLSEYRKSVDSTAAYVADLRQYEDGRKDGSYDAETAGELIAIVRKNLPVSERVEWPGGSIETSNAWFVERFDAFEKETDPKKRAEILTGIGERLSAISEKVKELENPSAADRTKDEDKQKLAEILNRAEYQKPAEKKESTVERWVREFFEWLESLFPKPKSAPAISGMPNLALILQVLIFAAIAALIGFGIYKFAPILFPKLRRRPKKKEKDRVILGERIAADESAADLFDDAERLARDGDLRGAIRKGYIALLCELSDRKIIGLARNKTNRDYLRDVRARRDLHTNMSGLTNEFERHWYGFQPSENDDWENFRQNYKQTIKSVG
jgi:hypothetical protein